MKLLNYKINDEIHLGIQTEKGIVDVPKLADNRKDISVTMEDLINYGDHSKMLCLLNDLLDTQHDTISFDKAEYAPCILNPEKILCVGCNYFEHAKECNQTNNQYPIIFSKFKNTLAAHKQVIPLPDTAKHYDYEAELVIIIGKEGFKIPKSDALSYVFGYTAGDDLSARDLQNRTGQWLIGKTLDYFAPTGPCVVTADEIDSSNLEIRCEVNGEVRQQSNTHKMIFDCASIISYVSNYMTLKPGDIIFTGTPSGVILGKPADKQQWLKSGDEVAVIIENIGKLVNVLK
jgi:2-keto-4-pentenoate hydratase/2-oxohepta-3-ene-1,7-dioic acid hydratase in catechol pathway